MNFALVCIFDVIPPTIIADNDHPYDKFYRRQLSGQINFALVRTIIFIPLTIIADNDHLTRPINVHPHDNF